MQNHDGRVLVRRYASKRCFPECVIERHSGRTQGVTARGGILYHARSNLLRTEVNLSSNKYVREVLQPEVFPFLQGIPGDTFSRIMHDHMLQRLFKVFVQPNTCNVFLGLLIRRIRGLLSMCEIWLVGV